MMMRTPLLLVLLSCLALGALAGFQGQWTDSHSGLTQSFCVNGGSFSGLYGEAGVYVGSVSGNTASGNFYEAGHHQECGYGTFTFVLNPDDGSFVGSKTCEFRVVRFNETRLSSAAPTPLACGQLASASNTDLRGRFNDSANTFMFDRCFDNGIDWTGSFDYLLNNGTATYYGKGFESGQVYENGRVAQGRSVWQDTTGSVKFHYHVLHLLQDSGVTSYYWCGPKSYSPISFGDLNTQCHKHLSTALLGPVPARQGGVCLRYVTLITLIAHHKSSSSYSSSSSSDVRSRLRSHGVGEASGAALASMVGIVLAVVVSLVLM